jgi:hypothetical protein
MESMCHDFHWWFAVVAHVIILTFETAALVRCTIESPLVVIGHLPNTMMEW